MEQVHHMEVGRLMEDHLMAAQDHRMAAQDHRMVVVVHHNMVVVDHRMVDSHNQEHHLHWDL